MATASPEPTTRVLSVEDLPESDRLVDGMRLDSIAEYVRRGEAMERAGLSDRSELIRGIVTMSPPPDVSDHGMPGSKLGMLLALYESETPGVASSTESAVDLLEDDPSQVGPDLQLFILPEFGGQRTYRRKRLTGVPELIAEIANTSYLTDTTTKHDLYEAAGVQEYLIHAVRKQQFMVFRRSGDRLLAETLTDGVFRSTAFPGLHIDCDALVAADLRRARTTLEAGLATPQHAAFVTELAACRDGQSLS